MILKKSENQPMLFDIILKLRHYFILEWKQQKNCNKKLCCKKYYYIQTTYVCGTQWDKGCN
jgi:hypothetical protein